LRSIIPWQLIGSRRINRPAERFGWIREGRLRKYNAALACLMAQLFEWNVSQEECLIVLVHV